MLAAGTDGRGITISSVSLQLVTLLANLTLALLKFSVGLLAGSHALIADGFNSAGDVLSTFVAWIAFRYGQRPPDADHHYGHDNAEALAGMLLGGILCATGAFICIDGLLAVFDATERIAPDRIAMLAAAVTIAAKAALYVASVRVGGRTRSPTLLAAARDHGADVLTGTVALLGIAIANAGYPSVDDLAGGLIGLYVFWLGIAPLRDNIGILMQESPPELAVEAAACAEEVDGVRGVRGVRATPLGGSYRMDMVLVVPGDWSVTRAHTIAHVVERAVQERLPHVTEVHVHVEPE
jgi:cation diffusion facilitator family transporter